MPLNASNYGMLDDGGFYCNKGYLKKGNTCVRKVLIPSNAYASNNIQGWKMQ